MNDNHDTALMVACHFDSVAVASVLLENGANVGGTGAPGECPECCKACDGLRVGSAPIYSAIKHDSAHVAYLLLK